MPYKSDAQRRFFHAAEQRGEISKSTVHEYDQASKGKDLPEKVQKHAHGGIIHPDHIKDEYKHLYMGGYAEGGEVAPRYEIQDHESKERLDEQESPSMESEGPSLRMEPHHESELPSSGFDEYMTEMVGNEHDEEGEDAMSRQNEEGENPEEKRREFAEALKRRRR